MFASMESWSATARDRLVQLSGQPWGWSDGTRSGPCIESSVLACLALSGLEEERGWVERLEVIDASAQGLADLQRPDGALAVTADGASGCRATAYATFLWSHLLHYQRPLAAALRWLQQCNELAPGAPDDGVPGYVPARTGGSGAETAGGEIEAAALTVLALCCNELSGHPRVAEATQGMLQQALPAGGWTKRPAHLGEWQTPDVLTTGVALVAIRAAQESQTRQVTGACDYLEVALREPCAPEALSWGLLGFMAWRPGPTWAAETLDCCVAASRHLSVRQLALLLLASQSNPLALWSVSPVRDDVPAIASCMPIL